MMYNQVNYGMPQGGGIAGAGIVDPMGSVMQGGTQYNVGGGSVVPGQMGQTGGQGGFFRHGDGSFNWNSVGTIMSGISSLGQLWGAVQQTKLAREQFDFQKKAYKTNLRNSVQTYNTALADRINARYHMEGRSDQAGQYLDEHSLRT